LDETKERAIRQFGTATAPLPHNVAPVEEREAFPDALLFDPGAALFDARACPRFPIAP
jgi:hypothetical protein